MKTIAKSARAISPTIKLIIGLTIVIFIIKTLGNNR